MTVRELHSVHADLVEAARHAGYTQVAADQIARAVTPVEATIALLPSAAIPSAREEASDLLVELIHEHLRDSGTHVVELRVEGLSRADWDQRDGTDVNGWTKREEFRDGSRALVAAVEWSTDEGWGR